jgi:hypothetical protein
MDGESCGTRFVDGLEMCPCDGFAERQNFHTLREYHDVVRQLIALVASGRFLLDETSCPLEDMLCTPLPGDVVSHDLQCPDCGRRFHLFADAYHGRGGWRLAL